MMCNKRNTIKTYVEMSNKSVRVDSCISMLIYTLNRNGIKTLGSCCGHGKYNLSIVIQGLGGEIIDMVSGIEIPRKKRFYKRDKEGYFYIPELYKK